MTTKYYSKPENVLFLDRTTRTLAKIFGAKYFVKRCKVCGKIPTEIYEGHCFEHIPNLK